MTSERPPEAARLPWPPLVAVAGRCGAMRRWRSAQSWPHALLIHGARGHRQACARAQLRRRGCCARTPRADGLACGECAGCRYAVAGQHPDLMRIELLMIDQEQRRRSKRSTPSRIDRVRALIEFVQLTSHRQRAKVAVIAPAERMNAAAANALLKTLEEPPPGTYLILVSDRARDACRRRCARAAASSRRRAPDWPRPRDMARRHKASRRPISRWRRRRRAARGARHRRSGGAGRATRLACRASAKPERLPVMALAARIDAGGKDERRARLAHAHRLARLPGPRIWRASPRAAPRANPDVAAALAAPRAAGGADRRCFAIIGHCSRSARCSRIRCNRVSSPRRCCIGYRELFR